MTKIKNIESLDAIEEDEFVDGAFDIGKPIATFSFVPAPAEDTPLHLWCLGRLSFICCFLNQIITK